MSSITAAPEKINKTVNYTTVATPFVHSNNGKLAWDKVEEAVSYIIIKNGKKLSVVTENNFTAQPIAMPNIR